MTQPAVISSILLLAFTVFLILTDGAPTDRIYVLFTALLVLIPVLNVLVLSTSVTGRRAGARPPRAGVRAATIIGNVALFGFTCWALVDQYPHPPEPGLVTFILVVLLTPVLAVTALWRQARTS